MSYQVLARKWRPLTFETVVGQTAIVRTLQNALGRARIAHAYLFAGPRGVGKTTTARLLAMGLNCERPREAGPVPCATCGPCREIVAGRALDVIEIDGASNRGIDEVRALRENTRYAPARGRHKVYIIDEVHMLTEPAFNALLKTLEEPPAHVVFVLATTEARRLPPTILSRCQRFDFRPIAVTEIVAALRKILDEERTPDGPGVEADALLLIARAADGSLRDALSLLDTALAYGAGQVTAAAVRELLGSGGAAAAWGLAEALVERAAAAALELVGRAAAEGLDLGLLCQEALEVLRQALLARVLPSPPLELTAEETTRLLTLGGEAAASQDDLLLLVKGLLEAEVEMRRSPHPRVDLEVAVVRLCHRPEPQTIEAVLDRLEQAEARLRGYGSVPARPAVPIQEELLGGPSGAPPARPGTVPRPPDRLSGPPARPPLRSVGPGGEPGPGDPALSTATAVSSPSVGSVGDVRSGATEEAAETWRRIVEAVTRVRPTLGHLLASGVVVAAEAGRLTVAVPNGNAFTQDQLRSASNRELLVEAARRVCPGVSDVVLTTGGGAGSWSGLPTDHPLVQAAVELFNGEVTLVRPAASHGARGAEGAGAAAPEDREAT